MTDLDPRLRAMIDKITAKRARVVIDHILAHGFITTEDLANYGYNHPPRAARDVRELGIPLVTYRVEASDGRKIGAYKFGDPDAIQHHKLGGRRVLSKELLNTLYERDGGRCAVCGHDYEKRYLQVDHRMPYEIAGEVASEAELEAFMLLCGTCQRKKSWSCERCDNWTRRREDDCIRCYWVAPAEYEHIAGEPIRRIELSFSGDREVGLIDRLRGEADALGVRVEDLLARLILDYGERRER